MAKLFEAARRFGEIFDSAGEGEEDFQIGQVVPLGVLQEMPEGVGIKRILNGGAGVELLLQTGKRERGRIGRFLLYKTL